MIDVALVQGWLEDFPDDWLVHADCNFNIAVCSPDHTITATLSWGYLGDDEYGIMVDWWFAKGRDPWTE